VVGVIVNPQAGRNRGRHERFPGLKEIVGNHGIVAQPPSLEALEGVAREFCDRGVRLLAVCGGDGSFFRTLSAFLRICDPERIPWFLPLRAGSMNTIARSVGVRPGSPEEVLAHVLARLRTGETLSTTQRHLLQVNERYYGFMVGAGVIVNFLQVYYSGRRSGPLAAAYWLARAVLSGLLRGPLARSLLAGFRAQIEYDGELLPRFEFNVLYASTIEDIGLGFSATYLATRKPGFFHCLAGALRPGPVILRLGRLWRGCPLRLPTLYDNLVREVGVKFEQPTPYTIDGDLLSPVAELRCEIGPRLTIVQG